ncbi:hypothetical protein NDN08_001903 [Rhodosorus marinus]|uniref:Uncharacterized protein n=1 Tax=Rhodosorus marinus TaxID=101924 RepID=A0AAV8UXZ0_9RHOD|nr:hypothetical protein NDN08_001903 [Rhodosorus marinus]
MEKYKEAIRSVTEDHELSRGHADSRSKEHLLNTILEHSKKKHYLDEFGTNNQLVESLISPLRDESMYLSVTTIQTLRILRNSCAKRDKNQQKCLKFNAHEEVVKSLNHVLNIDTLETTHELDAPSRRIKTMNLKLRREFILYSVQFLCNFTTSNLATSKKLWKIAFPTLMEELLKTMDDNVFAASAALVHNCIACDPALMVDVIHRWDKTVSHSRKGRKGSSKRKASEEGDDEKAQWIVTICRLALGAGNILSLFDATLSRSKGLNEATTLLQATESAVHQIANQDGRGGVAWSSIVHESAIEGMVDIITRFVGDRSISLAALTALSLLFESGLAVANPESIISNLRGNTLPSLLYLLRTSADGPLLGAILRLASALGKMNLAEALDIKIDRDTGKKLLEILAGDDRQLAQWSAKTIKEIVRRNAGARNICIELTATQNIEQNMLQEVGLEILVEKTSRQLQF